MPPQSNNTLSYRVDKLEKNFDRLDSKVDIILTNHLPHLSQDIVALRGDVKSVKTEVRAFAMINAASILVGLIVSKLFL